MGRDPIPRRRSYARADMRPPGATGYHPRFPAAVPVRGAGWSRVTQPFATRFFPEEGAVRLACVRRAASVHPEPGSNSPSKSPEGPGRGGPLRPACNADRIPFQLGDVLDKTGTISSPCTGSSASLKKSLEMAPRHLPLSRHPRRSAVPRGIRFPRYAPCGIPPRGKEIYCQKSQRVQARIDAFTFPTHLTYSRHRSRMNSCRLRVAFACLNLNMSLSMYRLSRMCYSLPPLPRD